MLKKIINIIFLGCTFIASTVYAQALPSITITDTQVIEGNPGSNHQLVMVATLSAPSTEMVTVYHGVQAVTATDGVDFIAPEGQFVFPPGTTTASLVISIIGDMQAEDNETLNLWIWTPTNATIATYGAVGTIVDDDSTPSTSNAQISITDASLIEGNSGTSVMTFTISLSETYTSPSTVDYQTQNGTATSGSDYVATSGTLTIATGNTSDTINVTVNGDTTVESNETFSVVLSNPSNATIADSTGVGTIQNDDVTLPVLSINDASVTEGNSGTQTVALTVSMSAAHTSAVSVNYATQNGTASAGSDYVATSSTLTIAAGNTSGMINVTVNGDTTVESNETFSVVLSNPSNATLGDGTGVVTITNDDASATPPVITLVDAQVLEGAAGTTTQLAMVANLSAPSSQTVSAWFGVSAVTATENIDYTAPEGEIIFAPGETTTSIIITVIGDNEIEADETINFWIWSPTNATIGDYGSVATILNDDPSSPLPQISIDDVTQAEGNSGTSVMAFTVSLSATHTSVVTVNYVTQDGTALMGSDYIGNSGTLTIAAGNTSGVINIVINGDTTVENNETFNVVLSNPSNATIADATGVGTIQNDDTAAGPPQITIADAQLTEGNSGTSVMVFNVSLSAVHTSNVSVDYATQNGSATSGSDYVAVSGTLTITAGNTGGTINVTVNGDENIESDEQFTVMLSNAVNATIADASATGTILDDDAVDEVGLDTRPSNTSCLASGVTAPSSALLSRYYSNLNFATSYPERLLSRLEHFGNRWFYSTTDGEFGWFDAGNVNVSSYNVLFTLTVDNFGEGGLLGFAFDPNFAGNGYIYFSYTELRTPDPSGHNRFTSVIARYTLNTATYALQSGSRLDLIRLDQPWANHNGGDIHFGPDGYLYIGFGDGGIEDDDPGNAQNPNNFFGAMLRIDVRNNNTADGLPYDIPSDNPFVSGGGAPEVWAYGLRNPWKWSFDRVTGRLWVGDVGAGAYEEVDIIEPGRNYGWPCREGAHNYLNSGQSYCQGKTFTDPVTEYARAYGAISGGYVYRGLNIPGLNGSFIYSDIYLANLFAAVPQGNDNYTAQTLIATGNGVAATVFGQDAQGEVYLGGIDGNIYRVEPGAGGGGSSGPASQLSATGCVDANDPSVPAAGVIPYSINEPFWSDNAEKERFVALPDTTQLQIDAEGDLIFPVGSVLVKTFRLGGQLIETRLLMHQTQGIWEGFSYEWNAAQTDATLLHTSKTVNINGQNWYYPSSGDCLACHTQVAGRALGPELKQLNKDSYYPSTDRTADQLATWEHIGYFNRALTATEKQQALTPSRDNPGADLDERARSYLHSNCAQCHQGTGSPSGVHIDFREHIKFANMNICNQNPAHGDLGISGAKLLVPGDPARSIIYARIFNNDSNRMPPLGSNLLDSVSAQMISDWIINSSTCTP